MKNFRYMDVDSIGLFYFTPETEPGEESAQPLSLTINIPSLCPDVVMPRPTSLHYGRDDKVTGFGWLAECQVSVERGEA